MTAGHIVEMTPDRVGTVVGLLGFGVAAVGSGFVPTMPGQRRFFWAFVTVGALVGGISAGYPNWTIVALLSGGSFLAMSSFAYVWTRYIKIRGKIYASLNYNVNAEGPPADDRSTDAAKTIDPYGSLTTAPKAWWGWVAAAALCTAGAWAQFNGYGRNWKAVGFVVVCQLIFVLIGYVEASLRVPIACGQTVQFVLFCVLSAGLGAVLYLIGYLLGRRWQLPGARRSLQTWAGDDEEKQRRAGL